MMDGFVILLVLYFYFLHVCELHLNLYGEVSTVAVNISNIQHLYLYYSKILNAYFLSLNSCFRTYLVLFTDTNGLKKLLITVYFIRYTLLVLDQTSFSLQNCLLSTWHRFNKVFLAHIDAADLLAAHPKGPPLNLDLVTAEAI